MQGDMQRQRQQREEQERDTPERRKRVELTQHPGTQDSTNKRLGSGQEHGGQPGLGSL